VFRHCGRASRIRFPAWVGIASMNVLSQMMRTGPLRAQLTALRGSSGNGQPGSKFRGGDGAPMAAHFATPHDGAMAMG